MVIVLMANVFAKQDGVERTARMKYARIIVIIMEYA
jgi:hypothetical protein